MSGYQLKGKLNLFSHLGLVFVNWDWYFLLLPLLGLAQKFIMMSVTSKSIDFAVKNFVSCGCSSNASFNKHTVRNYAKVNSKGCVRSHGARKLFCCKKRNTQYRVSYMKTAEPTVNGI